MPEDPADAETILKLDKIIELADGSNLNLKEARFTDNGVIYSYKV